MNDSKIFLLFNGLKYNLYIKKYFDYILANAIEKYEKTGKNKNKLIKKISDLYFTALNDNENNTKMNNDIKIIEGEKNTEIDDFYKSKSFNTSHNIFYKIIPNDIRNYNNFTKKYFIKWSKEKLLELLNKYENDEYMKLYINNKIELIEKNKNIFSIDFFIDEIEKSKQFELILNFYEKSFDIITKIINSIIERIINTIEFLPYGIKYISKIIYNFLINKFNDNDSKFKIFKFITRFVFINIFKNYFLYPENNIFLDSFIISEETKNNFIIIYDIFTKFISGDFFENEQAHSINIPYNFFFVENMPKIFQIYKKILDINFQKLSRVSKDDNNMNKNTIYSYSICLNINNLTTLLNIIKHNSKFFFENQEDSEKAKEEKNELEIIYNKLKANKDIFKSLKEKDNLSVNYYTFYEIFYSEEINNTFFNSANNLSKNFQIKEKTISDLNYVLIHSKNLMSDILYSIDLFNLKKISNNIDLNNLKKILTELSNYYSILNSINENNFNFKEIDEEVEEKIKNRNNNYNQTSILPIEWLINSLINYLDKLNIEYKENNYQKLFDSFEHDINDSINKYNFEIPSQIVEKLKNSNKYIKEYFNYQKKYKNIIINSNIRDFIKNEKIEVKIKYKYNLKDKIFKIKKDNKNNKSIFSNIFKKQSKNEITIKCVTIYELCNKLPSLINLIQKSQNSEEKFNIQNEILNYFDIIKEHVDNKFAKINRDIVNLKIQKYIYKFINK